MEDRLETIFRLQKQLDEDIMTRRHLDFPYEVWMQKDILACMDELTELLNELNWKWWKNEKEYCIKQSYLHYIMLLFLVF